MSIIIVIGDKSTEGPVGASGHVVGQICICKEHIKPGQAVSKDEHGMYNHLGCHFRELVNQTDSSSGE